MLRGLEVVEAPLQLGNISNAGRHGKLVLSLPLAVSPKNQRRFFHPAPAYQDAGSPRVAGGDGREAAEILQHGQIHGRLVRSQIHRDHLKAVYGRLQRCAASFTWCLRGRTVVQHPMGFAERRPVKPPRFVVEYRPVPWSYTSV